MIVCLIVEATADHEYDRDSDQPRYHSPCLVFYGAFRELKEPIDEICEASFHRMDPRAMRAIG